MANIIEIGGGASGGSNVVANPIEAASDTLTKIGINGTVYSVSGGASGANYSTTEHTIGTWIDGSILYEKTFVLTSMITIGTDWSSTGITLTGADKIVDAVVYRIDTLGAFMVSVALNASSKAVSLLTVWNGIELSAGSTITLRYTKTS